MDCNGNIIATSFTGNGGGITNSGVYYNTNSGYVLDSGGQVHWPSPGNGAVITTAGDLQATNGSKIYKSGINAFGAVDGSALTGLNASALTSGTLPLSVIPTSVATNLVNGIAQTFPLSGMANDGGNPKNTIMIGSPPIQLRMHRMGFIATIPRLFFPWIGGRLFLPF